MKTLGWMVGALVAGGVVFTMRGGCLNQKHAPDESLAGRFTDLCQIAAANIETPERGVRKLGHYLGKHTGDMFGEWGSTLAEIERIDNDDKHDARALTARKRLAKPLRACQGTWMEFGQAVEDDPEANALVERFSIRLNRTIEIIFGESDGAFDLLKLPTQLERAFESKLR